MVDLISSGPVTKVKQQKRRRLRHRFASYGAYIASADWRLLRVKAIARDNHRCRICDSPDDLEVHHRRYPPTDRWDRDCLDALTTLCHDCHASVTDRLRARRYAATSGPMTHDIVRITPVLGTGDECERLQVIENQDYRRVTPALP